MEPPALVDSNIYIDILRAGRDPAVELTAQVSITDLATCGMVRVEVMRGVKNPRIRDGLARFLDLLQNVASDNRLWEETAALAWELDRKGWILPAPDLVIACSARRIGAVVLTNDRHFQKVPGLVVRAWPG